MRKAESFLILQILNLSQENVDEKDKRDWSNSSGSCNAVGSAYIASSVPGHGSVVVRGQGAGRHRAATVSRERCWCSPEGQQACIPARILTTTELPAVIGARRRRTRDALLIKVPFRIVAGFQLPDVRKVPARRQGAQADEPGYPAPTRGGESAPR